MGFSNHVSSIMHFKTDRMPETQGGYNMKPRFSDGHRLNFSVQLQYNFNEIKFIDGGEESSGFSWMKSPDAVKWIKAHIAVTY